MACPGLRRSFLAGPVSPANGRRSRPGETDRMHCSHGNLDAVAASGTPNPRKVATPDTPAVCAENEPADQWRQSAWPDIRWTGFPKAKPAAAGSVRQRIAAATHHGGDEIAAQPRPRYFKMAPPALIRRNQRTSSDPWLAEQPVMHGRRRSVLVSEKPSISMPLCVKWFVRSFFWCVSWSFSAGQLGVVGLVAGPGVAWPKSWRSGCEPAALATESFPACPPGP